MGTERHIYWLIVLNMLANVVAYVPRILLRDQLHGTAISILIGTVLGTVAMFWFMHSLKRLPRRQSLPDILKRHGPRWLYIPFSILSGLIWFQAGLITLISFSVVAKRYINPDMSLTLIAIFLSIVIAFGAALESRALLALLEILLVINVPVVALIFWKAYANEYFSWDAVFIPFTHIWSMPRLETVSACLYTFLGFMNMTVFQRTMHQLHTKWLWLVPFFGLGNLLTTFIVPIGMNGTTLAGQYIYPWFATADTLRMEFGFVERILFIFLLLYIAIALVNVMVHWHVSLAWWESLLPACRWRGISWRRLLLLLIFTGSGSFVTTQVSTEEIFLFARYWLMSLLPLLLIHYLTIHWLSRRVKEEAS